MIAKVLVNFTITALSRVAVPKLCIVSQVEAVAVTADVSLTAVPAKMPKASPLVVSNPKALPSIGKVSAATTLKRKITEMEEATSSSLAFTTGAVAATAEPPQMEEPTPIKAAVLSGMLQNL